jgi:signal transduction histidine kinase
MTVEWCVLTTKSKIWLAATASVFVVLLFAALLMPRSFGLTALSDIIQSLLLLSATASFIPLALRSQGRLRLFWILIALGVGLWMFSQLLWTYYEIILRQPVPGLFDGDIILFLHLVPLTAALALRPHIPRDEYAARLGRLDFALLLVWWFYLYALTVTPWQYVVPDVDAYSRNLNAVYLAEKLAFLAVLVVCWFGSNGQWRKLYGNLFGMGLCYAASSYVANWALARNLYYSGSLYDIPLAVAMAWLTWIGLTTETQAPESDTREVSTVYGVWVARCSMIAVFSLPLFAAWSMSSSAPAHIHYFRLVLTLAAAFVMGLMVLARQYLLDRELLHLLDRSKESFDGLKRLQAQIVQSEKLASIGQLVGGAAHELNNPITALLGYSDLLQSSPLTPEQQPLAARIGQQVRRTRSLVASLISFAGQAPASRTLIDLNAMARTAIKLTQNQWQALKIEVRTEFDPALPKVLGDSNQLLQVCMQLVGNGLHVMSEQGGSVLTVRTALQQGITVLQIVTAPALSRNAEILASSSLSNPGEGMALSACRGILQEHHGQILCQRYEDGAMLLRVELPVADFPSLRMQDSTAPALWQSQPSA